MTTTTSVHTDPKRRHDFVLLFDVTDGNPNGDPDAGNVPRVDPETMQGLVTDVALKRKVRDWVDIAHGSEPGYAIYVQHGVFLTDTRGRALQGLGPERSVERARDLMCRTFYDVRLFGAVMAMKEHNAGQVRGPLQLTFARSIDPVVPLDLSIVGPAQRAADSRSTGAKDLASYGTIGHKAFVRYGLYLCHGFFNPHFAAQTGVSEADLAIFWQALVNMWDLDRSAARGLMGCRGLYIFSHESGLGNAPAQALFERVRIDRVEGVDTPLGFRSYVVTVEDADLPAGVVLTRVI